MTLEFSHQILKKYSNINFHENLSSGSQIVSCEQTDEQKGRKTDMMNLIVTFCSFATTPKELIIPK
jgi:hypothetical protein